MSDTPYVELRARLLHLIAESVDLLHTVEAVSVDAIARDATPDERRKIGSRLQHMGQRWLEIGRLMAPLDS